MGHSHDSIDWDEMISHLRESDELLQPELDTLAKTLVRGDDRSVIDVGSGAGGAAAAFGSVLRDGWVTVVDSSPELLSAASAHVRSMAPNATVRAVQADAASPELDGAGRADLVFASHFVHHLPDQLDGLRRLARLVRPGGRLALMETGLPRRVLPWDVGVGEPGLEDRLLAARQEAFREMRTGMEGSVRMPMSWSAALAEIGMTDVHAWSCLVERRPPLDEVARRAVMRRLEWLRDAALERAAPEDVHAAERLLDPRDPHYVGDRDDVYILGVDSVYVGTKAERTPEG